MSLAGDRFAAVSLPALGLRSEEIFSYGGGPLITHALTDVQKRALADVLSVWRYTGMGDGLRARIITRPRPETV